MISSSDYLETPNLDFFHACDSGSLGIKGKTVS
jgi:hypothetical protein